MLAPSGTRDPMSRRLRQQGNAAIKSGDIDVFDRAGAEGQISTCADSAPLTRMGRMSDFNVYVNLRRPVRKRHAGGQPVSRKLHSAQVIDGVRRGNKINVVRRNFRHRVLLLIALRAIVADPGGPGARGAVPTN